jgi:protein-S-isoprenylcysteine O-methyltransferase Ste14
MFPFVRALIYASVFASLFFVFLPAQVLTWAGISGPEAYGPAQISGMIVTLAGVAVMVWCVASFATAGKGTPAPFDPPRRLVVRGPYRYVRNPMYVGAIIGLIGASLYFRSLALLGYTAVFWLAAHTFILMHEEPALRRSFGDDYAGYCRAVHRWRPRPVSTRVKST